MGPVPILPSQAGRGGLAAMGLAAGAAGVRDVSPFLVSLRRHMASQAAHYLKRGAFPEAVLGQGPITVCQRFAREHKSLRARRHTLPVMNARFDAADQVLP